jgi:hypothetical protein
LTGTLRAGDSTRLAADDNSYYQLNSAGSVTSWSGRFSGVPNSLSSLRVTYAGANSSFCSQTVSIWNATTSTWATLDSRWVGSEVVINATVGGTLADYVTGATGTGDVSVRVHCLTYFAFYSSADLLKIVYDA